MFAVLLVEGLLTPDGVPGSCSAAPEPSGIFMPLRLCVYSFQS